MKKSLLSTIVLGSALFLAACGGGDDSSSTGETAELDGKKIVQQSCATCHGGQLQGGNAPALDKLGAKYSEEEILDIILNGKDRMPPGLLKGAEAEAAAGYLAGLK
ncbi:cytochrome c551 [Solibacillus sp. FSL H8-0523]|uniref:cytochrome c551 n=1 Tax=unclassified Solibacillus TaxID=2637870 RepID=UPI003100ED2A